MIKTNFRELFFNTLESIKNKHDINENDFYPKITPENVFQKAITLYRDDFINNFLKKTIKPDSKIIGTENVKKLHELCLNGKSCMILARHVGNFDVPNLYYLMKKNGLIDIFDDIVFIAGRKLNEEEHLVRLLAVMFNRIVIIPKGENVENAQTINMSAQRELRRLKKNGKMILLYPTGTRERPWDKESYRGIREAYNYVKSFDYAILLNVCGNNIITGRKGLLEDEFVSDTIVFTFSEVYESKNLMRELCTDKFKDYSDEKQYFADKLVDKIRSL